MPAYVSALCGEVQHVGARAPEGVSVHTVFFGGGTPSLLSPEQIQRVLETIRGTFQVEDGAEVTLEANPGTVSAAGMQSLRAAGINRISLGVQSANGEELRMLERAHTYGDVLDAVAAARRAGFDNLNVDLIYGLPEQTMDTWQTTVRRVLDLKLEHMSAYALTLEHGTPFGRWTKRGLLPTPDPDLAADMYEWLSDELGSAGYGHYEISNWAKDGRECSHNLQYWRGEAYLGFGAGAHGYAAGYRYSNLLAIKSYIERISEGAAGEPRVRPEDEPLDSEEATGKPDYTASPAAISRHRQSAEDDMAEFMIMGLRLTAEGVSAGRFHRRFGRKLSQTYGRQLEDLMHLGLLERAESNASEVQGRASEAFRLTKRGRLVGNQVFIRFLSPHSARTPRPVT